MRFRFDLAALLLLFTLPPGADARELHVDRTAYSPTAPQLQVWQGRLWLAAWMQESSFDVERTAFAWSNDRGQTWHGGERFPYTEYSSGLMSPPSLLVDDQGTFYAGARFTYLTGATRRIVQQLRLYRGRFDGGTFHWSDESPLWIGPSIDENLGERIDALQLAQDGSRHALYATYTYQAGVGALTFDSAPIFQYSEDAGRTWSERFELSGGRSGLSRIAAGPGERVTAVWYDFDSNSIQARTSADGGHTFEPEVVVAPTFLNVGAQSAGNGPNGEYRVHPLYPCAWESEALSPPGVAVDLSGGPYAGRIYVAWAEHADGVVSSDPPTRLTEDEPNDTPATAQPIEIGTWVFGTADSRDAHPGETDLFRFHLAQGETVQLTGYLTFFSATPPGLENSCYPIWIDENAFLSDYAQTEIRLLGHGTPAPCYFSAPFSGDYLVNVGSLNSPISEGYGFKLLRFEPATTSVARDMRDIVLVHSDDGGRTWSAKTRVNDDAPGFENELPHVTVDAQGLVHVTWYDRSEDVGRGLLYTVHTSASSDGGVSFAPSTRLGPPAHDFLAARTGAVLGDGLAQIADRDSLITLWADTGMDRRVIAGDVSFNPSLAGLNASLRALRHARRVYLLAELSTDWQPVSLELWRSTDGGGWIRRAVLSPAGAHLSFVDEDAPSAGQVSYRLLVTPPGGPSRWTSTVPARDSGHDPSQPLIVSIRNPSHAPVEFLVAPAASGPLSIEIFDLAGRRVTHFTHEATGMEAGTVTWDGTTSSGSPAASGRYWIRVSGVGPAASIPFALVR